MANPLVAGPVNTSTPFTGTFLLEDGEGLVTAFRDGDWLSGGMTALATAGDIMAAMLDPIGAVIGAGVGWLLEHMEPLRGWLNDLTGDAGEVAGFALTWQNVEAQLTGAADLLDHYVSADLADMYGKGIDAYRAAMGDTSAHIRAAGSWASAMGTALQVCSSLVQIVHDMVRDALAEVVGSVLSAAIQVVFSLGAATPKVIADCAAKISKWATKLGNTIMDLLSSCKLLKGLMDKLTKLLAKARSLWDEIFHGRGPRENVTPEVAVPVAANKPPGRTDWLTDPDVNPDLLDNGIYDPRTMSPTNGMDIDEWITEYHKGVYELDEGSVNWSTVNNGGKVPGSERILNDTDGIFDIANGGIDRVGGDRGTWFGKSGTPWDRRSLPPETLPTEYSNFDIDVDKLRHSGLQLEETLIEPAFNQPGGGLQYQFIGTDGRPRTVAELIRDGILRRR